ncbi:hypothetical protein [Streptomyces sp. NBC_00893]|uniref:hypothetical protein n=1 Tax=Streptomyces sp. NBC_00893 TaxID=2975862 RepID=UPI00224ECE17|nr:hypothetical protein [Streptomyces sp. NBC_00893]MCX4849206.1 hypothetical protein [Streptomyces sp. NBC_00893]
MRISCKIATGAISLLSFAAIAAGAAPASASQTVAPAPTTQGAKGACMPGWKNAGSIPGKWSTINDRCPHFGSKGMKMGYAWKVYKGSSICVQVKGFNAKGKKTWYNAGCGKSGQIKVPWGNVADTKEMKVKGAALLRWY